VFSINILLITIDILLKMYYFNLKNVSFVDVQGGS